jgi:hypothetical protein
MADGSLQHHGTADLDYLPPDDDWASLAYQRITAQHPGWTLPKWMKILTGLLLGCVCLLGALFIILGALEEYHPIVRVCPKCHEIIIAFEVSGSITVLLSVVGALCAVFRLRKVVVGFFGVMMLLGGSLLALFVFVLVYRLNPNLNGFEEMWRSAVRNDQELICTVQNNLDCSGFRYGCCHTNTTALVNDSLIWDASTYASAAAGGYCYVSYAINASTVALVNGVPAFVGWPSEVCVPSCPASSAQTTLCSAELERRLDQYAAGVLGVLLSLVVIVVSAAVLTCKATFRHEAPERVILLAASDD